MFYDRLKQACKERGTNVTATLKAIGIGGANGTYWKNGSVPSSDIVVKLAEFLNVTTDYLLVGKNGETLLKEDEQELINFYNKLPPKEQQRLIGRAATLAELYAEQVETQVAEADIPMIEIKHSYYKVSAGTGYNLTDGDQWDTIEVPDMPEANKADFALTISGDSMEPVYYDGDIVLIKSQPAIDSGEIGIFIIENNGYIKKYGGDRLISLNAKYDDIMFSDYDPDDIRCMGLVIGRV